MIIYHAPEVTHDHYWDVRSDMRRYMIPIVGFLMVSILSIIAGVLATRGTRTFRSLKYLLLFHVLTQMVLQSPSLTVYLQLIMIFSKLCAVLLLATEQWEYAVQLALTAILGLFATITLAGDYMLIVSDLA